MTTKTLSARDRRVAESEQWAARNFAGHVITERLSQGMFRSWRCQTPGDWNCAFDLTTTPGHLIITGDIGDLIVTRTEDMLVWSRTAVHSIDYFAEKVPHAIPTREWDRDVVAEWVAAELAEEQAQDELDQKRIAEWQELADVISDDEIHEGGFADALSTAGLIDGCDWPTLTNWTRNFLWCREAVKWFLANHQQVRDVDTQI